MAKIAVYGSLRKGFHNHSLIENSTFLGEFKTEPIYQLFSLGSFPGVYKGGNIPLTLEVYEVDDQTANRVDMLEGYFEDNPPEQNYYNKEIIETPFGEAGIYLYGLGVGVPNPKAVVESGDWAEYKSRK